jgi:hypothetical protein
LLPAVVTGRDVWASALVQATKRRAPCNARNDRENSDIKTPLRARSSPSLTFC